jgi:hypothetical protein
MNQDQINMIVGILLMVMGLVYFHKSFMAGVQGKMWYWQGFLPFTLISPWIVVFKPKENSLCKEKEAMWVHAFFGPAFFCSAIIALSAGADMANLPGTATTNKLFTMFLPDKTPLIVFDKKHYRMQFPAVVTTSKKLAKLFFANTLGLSQKDDLTPFQSGSYADAMQQ